MVRGDFRADHGRDLSTETVTHLIVQPVEQLRVDAQRVYGSLLAVELLRAVQKRQHVIRF
jgi:hypothetical protein